MSAESYPYLRAWAQYWRYGQEWTSHLVALAEEDGAPQDAISKHHEGEQFDGRKDGSWRTFEELHPDDPGRAFIVRELGL